MPTLSFTHDGLKTLLSIDSKYLLSVGRQSRLTTFHDIDCMQCAQREEVTESKQDCIMQPCGLWFHRTGSPGGLFITQSEIGKRIK